MSRNPIPVMLLHGQPAERGRQHGAAFAAAIQGAIRKLRADRQSEAFAKARHRAIQSWPLTERLAPEVAAELKGLAQGASCDVIDIYLHAGFEFFNEPSATGCSSVACTGTNGAVIGQNWDAPPDAAADLILFIHSGVDGFEQAYVASIGTLGWVGCNRHGLAFTNNDLLLDTAPYGLPSQIVRRLLLAEPDVVSALRILRDLPHMGGRCYLLGDASGAIAGVEVSPMVGVRAMAPVSPILHTNHARLAEMLTVENAAELQALYPSSRHRLAALQAVAGDVTTVPGLTAVLRNRDGAPDAISKSFSSQDATETAFSIIFDCGQQAFHLCAGPPSMGHYIPFRMEGRFGVSSNENRTERAEF